MYVVNTLAIKAGFVIIFAFLVIERLINTFKSKVRVEKSVKTFHKSYFYILLSGYLFIVLISFFIFLFRENFNPVVSCLGGLILLAGIICRRAAIRGLGAYWSPFIEIKKNQKVIKSGIYRYVKHPYYTSVVLELAGFSLFSNAYAGLVLIVFLQIPLLLVRIHYENRILSIFGKRYRFDL